MKERSFLKDLQKEYAEARLDASKQYLVVIVKLPDTPMSEVIINPRPNFDRKVTYYATAYKDDGTLVHNPNIEVEAFKFVNDMDEANEFIYNFS